MIPTMFSFLSARETISSENTDVQEGPLFVSRDLPVSGSICPTAWNWSSVSSSARVNPLPFWVIAWTITGASNFSACLRACSIASRSCPSIGPMYLMSRLGNMLFGANVPSRPLPAPRTVENSNLPGTPNLEKNFLELRYIFRYIGSVRTSFRYLARPPIVGA